MAYRRVLLFSYGLVCGWRLKVQVKPTSDSWGIGKTSPQAALSPKRTRGKPLVRLTHLEQEEQDVRAANVEDMLLIWMQWRQLVQMPIFWS